MYESMRVCHVALCISSISFSFSPHPILISMASLSRKYRRLRGLVPPLVILNIPVSQNIEGLKEKKRERERECVCVCVSRRV